MDDLRDKMRRHTTQVVVGGEVFGGGGHGTTPIAGRAHFTSGSMGLLAESTRVSMNAIRLGVARDF
ncbi:MAG: hypothetical protein ACREV8_02255, partial [Gammaproteobacteria bacterium]